MPRNTKLQFVNALILFVLVSFYSFLHLHLTSLVVSFVVSRMATMMAVMTVIGMFSLPGFRLCDYQR